MPEHRRPRDENGWRIPKEGTKLREVYDRLKAGAAHDELRREFGHQLSSHLQGIKGGADNIQRQQEPPVPPRSTAWSDMQQEFRENRKDHRKRRFPLPKVGDLVGAYGFMSDSCGRVEEIDPETGLARIDWDYSIRSIGGQRPPNPSYVHDLTPPYSYVVERSKFATEKPKA